MAVEWFKSLTRKLRMAKPNNDRRPVRLGAESLENREMPAAVTATLAADGVLHIVEPNAMDRVDVRQNAGQISIRSGPVTYTAVPITVATTGENRVSVGVAQVRRVEVDAAGGGDYIFTNNGSQQINLPITVGNPQGNSLLYAGTPGTKPVATGGSIKFERESDGTIYALKANGNLLRNGSVSWTQQKDFALDTQNRVITLDDHGNLSRSKGAFASGGWDPIGSSGYITKFQLGADGSVWALSSTQILTREGGITRVGVLDFSLAPDNSYFTLDAPGPGQGARLNHWLPNGGWDAANSFNDRSVVKFQVDPLEGTLYVLDTKGNFLQKPTGFGLAITTLNVKDAQFASDGTVYTLTTSGVLKYLKKDGYGGTYATGVAKFAVDVNNSLWVLNASGEVRINGGNVSWDHQKDFAFDSKNRVVMLDDHGNLARSIDIFGNNGWDYRFTTGYVTKFSLTQTGSIWGLSTDGWLSVDGSHSWARTRDFAFNYDNRVYWLGTDVSSGSVILQLSNEPLGSGGWRTDASGADPYAQSISLRADGSLWLSRNDTGVQTVEYLRGGSPTATLDNGILKIVGSGAADKIIVKTIGNTLSVECPAGTFTFATNAVSRVVVQGGAGADTIDLSGIVGIESEIFGGAGNDILIGGSGMNFIYGGADNDTVRGGDNWDWLYGGTGDDSLYGNGGVDALAGGDGHDTLSGGAGNDSLLGGSGLDMFFVQTGDTILDFTTGDSKISI